MKIERWVLLGHDSIAVDDLGYAQALLRIVDDTYYGLSVKRLYRPPRPPDNVSRLTLDRLECEGRMNTAARETRWPVEK